MKKALTILLALLLTLSVVACGSTTTTKTDAPKETKAEKATEAPKETKAEEETEAPVEIPVEAPDTEPEPVEDQLAASKEKFAEAIASMRTTDDQLLMPDPIEKSFPDRPEDPAALAEDEAGRYYDMEYVGWDATEKSPDLPESPADGAIGKKVIVIVHGDHAWTTAYSRGFKNAGEALGMTIDVWSPNWDQAIQDQMIDQAINEAPDAIALIPLSAENATQQFRKITQAGIPAFGTNTLTTSDAMQYMIAWTGPDDWAQMRQLADMMADVMEGQGGVAYITHNVGTSPYYARTYGPITEFKEKYPEIKTLDIQSPGFEAAQSKQVVSDWITRFGDELTGIFLADDNPQATGTIDAIKESGRTDIVVVAAGNSKIGQDLVKSGDLHVINYQSAEADAGLSARTIASWFNGDDILDVGYLTTDMITQENVDGFYPTQW